MTKCKECKYLETNNYRRHLKKEQVHFCNRPGLDGVEFLLDTDLEKVCPYGY